MIDKISKEEAMKIAIEESISKNLGFTLLIYDGANLSLNEILPSKKFSIYPPLKILFNKNSSTSFFVFNS